jgi:hypothetical protein
MSLRGASVSANSTALELLRTSRSRWALAGSATSRVGRAEKFRVALAGEQATYALGTVLAQGADDLGPLVFGDPLPELELYPQSFPPLRLHSLSSGEVVHQIQETESILPRSLVTAHGWSLVAVARNRSTRRDGSTAAPAAQRAGTLFYVVDRLRRAHPSEELRLDLLGSTETTLMPVNSSLSLSATLESKASLRRSSADTDTRATRSRCLENSGRTSLRPAFLRR